MNKINSATILSAIAKDSRECATMMTLRGQAETERRLTQKNLIKESIPDRIRDSRITLACESYNVAILCLENELLNKALCSLWDATLETLDYLLSCQNLRASGSDHHAIPMESAVDQFPFMRPLLEKLGFLRTRRNQILYPQSVVNEANIEEVTQFAPQVKTLIEGISAFAGRIPVFH